MNHSEKEFMAKVNGHMLSGFEPYKLTQVQLMDKNVGHGSYTSVVELKYMGLKRAGKVIHEELLEQGDTSHAIRRFEEESRILSRVRHPNIVQFLGVYFNDSERLPMLVMEFLPMNLTSCIEKQGAIVEGKCCSILHDVALGLCYLHSQSPPIIHRDLSANNVLLTYSMQAKISDLGIARILNLSPLQASRKTKTPHTHVYMPPEVMVAKPIFAASVDVFSFGVLMIHILSGKWPEPECGHTRIKDGRVIPITQAERHRDFLQHIGNDHPLMKLILRCIDDNPKERIHANELTQKVSLIKLRLPKEPNHRPEMARSKQSISIQDGTKYDQQLRAVDGQARKSLSKARISSNEVCRNVQ